MDIRNFVDSFSFDTAPVVYTYNEKKIPTALRFVGATIAPHAISNREVFLLFLRADTHEIKQYSARVANNGNSLFAHLDTKTGKLSDPIECNDWKPGQDWLPSLVIKWIIHYYNDNTSRPWGEAIYNHERAIIFKRYQWIENEVRECFVGAHDLHIRADEDGVFWLNSKGENTDTPRFSFLSIAPFESNCTTYLSREKCLKKNKISYFAFDDCEETEDDSELYALKAELEILCDKAREVKEKINAIINK